MNKEKISIDMPQMDYGQVKDKLFIRVRNAAENAEVLDGVPHKDVEDLAITYHIRIEIPGEVLASTMVTDQLMDKYGITPEQLHEDALKSSRQILPAEISSMQNILFEMMPQDLAEDMEMDSPAGNTMMVVTNTERVNGASALFYPDVMEQAAEKMQGNFFVLPSSIHEVIMIPADEKTDFRELEAMVTDINHSMIAPDERLSDHVYHYDAQERLFERADRHEMRLKEQKVQNPE